MVDGEHLPGRRGNWSATGLANVANKLAAPEMGLRRLARRQRLSMQAALEDLCRRALASESDAPTLAGVIPRLRACQGELEPLGIRQLDVYGSVARGDARPWSDIHLFADLADEASWNIVRRGHVLHRLEEILGRRVDFAARRSRQRTCASAPAPKRSRLSRKVGTTSPCRRRDMAD